jgi:hypothetical protein
MKRNFLLGKGEPLAEDIVVRSGGGPKEQPYTFAEAQTRLAPKPQARDPDSTAIKRRTPSSALIASRRHSISVRTPGGIESFWLGGICISSWLAA